MAITNQDIWDYIDYVKDNPNDTNKWIKLLVSKIAIPVLKSDDYYLDEERYTSAIAYAEANYYKLFPYQKFIYAFAFIRRKDNDLLAFPTIIVIMGRGNGKDGMMMPLMNFLQTPLNGIANYHIDIVANSEDQAIDSFNVVHDMLEENKNKFSKKFRWNMETITDRTTNSRMRYNTSNAKTKDGKKIGAIFFNEYHAYETYSQITVFTSGLGKIPDPRKFIVTTFGYVRDGPLDNLVKTIKRILSTGKNELGYFPMYFCLDDESEVGLLYIRLHVLVVLSEIESAVGGIALISGIVEVGTIVLIGSFQIGAVSHHVSAGAVAGAAPCIRMGTLVSAASKVSA